MAISTLQIGWETFLYIIPIVICLLLSMRRGTGGRGPSGPMVTDVWYMPMNISESYQLINDHVQDWMKEEVQVQPSRIPFFGNSQPSTGYRVIEKTDPRFLKLHSRQEGEVTYELTEIQGGGTAVKTVFSLQARPRIQSLRAQLPLKIPGMKACVACDRLLLSEFAHCPYCGTKQDQEQS